VVRGATTFSKLGPSWGSNSLVYGITTILHEKKLHRSTQYAAVGYISTLNSSKNYVKSWGVRSNFGEVRTPNPDPPVVAPMLLDMTSLLTNGRRLLCAVKWSVQQLIKPTSACGKAVQQKRNNAPRGPGLTVTWGPSPPLLPYLSLFFPSAPSYSLPFQANSAFHPLGVDKWVVSCK